MTGYPPPGYAPDWLLIEVLRSEIFGPLSSQDEDDAQAQWLAAARQILALAAAGRLTLFRPGPNGPVPSERREWSNVKPRGHRPWSPPGMFGEPLLVRNAELEFPLIAELVWGEHDIFADPAAPSKGGRPKQVEGWLIEFDALYPNGRTESWPRAARALRTLLREPVNPETLAAAWNARERRRGRR